MRPIQADSKGRINLGSAYAGQLFQITSEEARIILDKAVLIPERELWVHENPDVKATIEKGLAQAREGKISKEPIDLDSYEL